MKYLTAKQILDRFNIKSPTTLWATRTPKNI